MTTSHLLLSAAIVTCIVTILFQIYKPFGLLCKVQRVFTLLPAHDGDPSHIVLARFKKNVRDFKRTDHYFYNEAILAGYSPAPPDVMESIQRREDLPFGSIIQSRVGPKEIWTIVAGRGHEYSQLYRNQDRLTFQCHEYVALVPTNELRVKPPVTA